MNGGTSKRFWLFAGMEYYPGGGMADFIDSYDTLEEAKATKDFADAEESGHEWAHIYDTETGKTVYDHDA